MDAAAQRKRFRFRGSNFPARDFVSVLLAAQQRAQPKALISPINFLPFSSDLFLDHAGKSGKISQEKGETEDFWLTNFAALI